MGKPHLVPYITKKSIKKIKIVPINCKAVLRKPVKTINNNSNSNNGIVIVIISRL
jgi:hypothetical protein